MALALIAYFLLCARVAYGGRNRRSGFLGFFVACLLATPLLVLLVLILTSPAKSDA